MRTLLLCMTVVLGWVVASTAHAITVKFNNTSYSVDSFTITYSDGGAVITTYGDGTGSTSPPPAEPPSTPPAPAPTPTPPPPTAEAGSCVESNHLKCGTLNWSSPGGRMVASVKGTNETMAWEFTTSSNPTYSGDVNISETTGNELVSRRLWISTEPGGAALPNFRCSVEGNSTRKIAWSQQPNFLRCALAPSTTYFLNVKNVSGCSNSANCGFYRNTGTSGNP